MTKFLNDNGWQWRLLRTIAQGVLGAIVANVDVLVGAAWLDRVKAKTGVTPGIYMSKSTCTAADWSAVAKAYPLWVAQYPNYEHTGYRKDPWTDANGCGAWEGPLIFQYTSSAGSPATRATWT